MKEKYQKYITNNYSFDKVTMLAILALIIVITGIFGFLYEYIFYSCIINNQLGDFMNDLKILLNDINKIYQLSYYKLYYKNLEQKDKIEECNRYLCNRFITNLFLYLSLSKATMENLFNKFLFMWNFRIHIRARNVYYRIRNALLGL